MSSEALNLVTLCAYLTEFSSEWRQIDYTATKMVKAVKGDLINGYFECTIAGKSRRFTQENVQAFVDRVPIALAKAIDQVDQATIVPIPNSHVTAVNTPNFRILDLANSIARASKGNLTVVPALVFKEPQIKSRNGGPRNPHLLNRPTGLFQRSEGPIVLLDDFCTTGGHIYRRRSQVRRHQVRKLFLPRPLVARPKCS